MSGSYFQWWMVSCLAGSEEDEALGWRKMGWRDLGRKNLFTLPNITNRSSRSSSQLLSSCAFLMTSKCLLNLDMSAALRLLSVCCSHPLFSHHTDTAIADLSALEDAALFIRTLKADSSHPSRPSISPTHLALPSRSPSKAPPRTIPQTHLPT